MNNNVFASSLGAAFSYQQLIIEAGNPFRGLPFDLDAYMRHMNNIAAHSSDIVAHNLRNVSDLTGLFSRVVLGNGHLKPVCDTIEKIASVFEKWREPIDECCDVYEVGAVNLGVNDSKVVLNLEDRIILKDYTFDKKVKNPNRAVILGNPFAGHGDIVDYRDRDHSLVSRFLENYDGKVFAMSSPAAKIRHKNYSFEDEVLNCNEATRFVANQVGNSVDFMAMCSRGKTLYCGASVEPELFRNIGVAGSPLDMDKGNAAIVNIAKSLPMSFYETLGDMHGGIVPGTYILAGFLGMQPPLLMGGFDVQLLKHVLEGNYERIEDRKALLEWYFNTIPLPQRQYVDECALFKYNSMVEGDVSVGGKKVDFSKLNHREHRLGGLKDVITPDESCCDVVTGSRDVKKERVNAGHFGLYTSPKVLDGYWANKAKELNYL